QGGLVARVALDQPGEVVEGLGRARVAAEALGLLDRGAVLILRRQHVGGPALPATGGLDAEEVVTVAAIGLAQRALSPAGLQRRLRGDDLGRDAEPLSGFARPRQHLVQEGALPGVVYSGG